MFKIAIICGGPSAERGISLNSARSLYDNLDKSKYEISILYFNPSLAPYIITPQQIYSNTPLDFDFKLSQTSTPLSEPALHQFLKQQTLIFPAIHGTFGEDGQLQALLNSLNLPYIGSSPSACANTSNKALTQNLLKSAGFFTVPHFLANKHQPFPTLPPGQYVAKPLQGGSSIGVQYFEIPTSRTTTDYTQKLEQVFQIESDAIIEPKFTGKEFTIIVVQNQNSEPVALLPTEIEFLGDKFFNYRKKYLATNSTRYHTPARFTPEIISKIRTQAEQAFKTLNLKDFARLDGWLSDENQIWFSDVNNLAGLEQNSFVFQQAAILGLTHTQFLDYLITKTLPKNSTHETQSSKTPIPILFGGTTAERQVSIMSGTNVYMKLRASKTYTPIPYFLTSNNEIYHIPHYLCLLHTVEEIEEKIHALTSTNFLETLKPLQAEILSRLKIPASSLSAPLFIPQKISLSEIASTYKFLFLGLHGGIGENGTIQSQLEQLNLAYNGSGPQTSKLCVNKFETAKILTTAQIVNVRTPRKKLINLSNDTIPPNIHYPIILKPNSDGSSAGVIKLHSLQELQTALKFFRDKSLRIPAQAIHPHHGEIELSPNPTPDLLLEEFIETDHVTIIDQQIHWQKLTDYIEVTIGVIGEKNNLYTFNPSQTIASNHVLSLEEKFMGGTGINLTPPPPPYVKSEAIAAARQNLKQAAEALGLEGYARIDTFMHTQTGELIIIEANNLPALTPSTVIFHQGLVENRPIFPLELIEKIIELGIKKH